MAADTSPEHGKASPDPESPITFQSRTDLSAMGRLFFGPRAISAIAITGVFLLGMLAFLYLAKPFLMPVLLALVLSFVFRPVVRVLKRMRIPQSLGALIVIVVFFGLLTMALMLLRQPAAEWLQKAPDSLHMLQMKVRDSLARLDRFVHLAQWFSEASEESAAPKKNLLEVQGLSVAGNVLGYTASFVTGTIEMIVLLYFLLASGDLLLRKTVAIMPSVREKQEALNLARDMEQTISRYLFTITIINLVVALFVALCLAWLDMPNPVLWGATAGLLNFVPYFGPFLMSIVLVLAGLLSFESTGRALAPAIVYLSIHAVEANLITPSILGRRLTLSPVAIFLSIMFWTWLWGMPGALLSVPLLMTIKIVCDHVKPLAPVGEFLSGDERKPLDSKRPPSVRMASPTSTSTPT